MRQSFLSVFLVMFVLAGVSVGSDGDRLVDEAIGSYKAFQRSPEVESRGNYSSGDLMEEFMAPILEELPWNELTVENLDKLVGEYVMQFNPEAEERGLARLAVLGRGDEVEHAHALLVRMALAISHSRNVAMEVDRAPTVAAIHEALTHPKFGEALNRVRNPDSVMYALSSVSPELWEHILPELFLLGEVFPGDAPSDAAKHLAGIFSLIRRIAKPEDAEKIERVRRQFVMAMAGALNYLHADEHYLEKLVATRRRLNEGIGRMGRVNFPRLGAWDVEYSRRSATEQLITGLTWLTSAEARGTLVGFPLTEMKFSWEYRPSDRKDLTPLRSSRDLRGSLCLLVSMASRELLMPDDPWSQSKIKMLNALADRFATLPVSIMAVCHITEYRTALPTGQMFEPPADHMAALRKAVDELSLKFSVVLLDGDAPVDIGGDNFRPMLLDHENQILAMDVRMHDLDDLTKQFNKFLIDLELVVEDGEGLPQLTRKAHPGNLAPNLEFEWTSEGLEAKTLEDLRGKVVVLDFWATWCGPCVASFPNTRALREKFSDEEVVIIGVTSLQGFHMTPEHERIATKGDPDGEYALMAEFMDEKDMTWAVAFTEQRVFNEDYGVKGIPAAFVIDQNGVVRSRKLNPFVKEDHRMMEEIVEQLLREGE